MEEVVMKEYVSDRFDRYDTLVVLFVLVSTSVMQRDTSKRRSMTLSTCNFVASWAHIVISSQQTSRYLEFPKEFSCYATTMAQQENPSEHSPLLTYEAVIRCSIRLYAIYSLSAR
jgi:hypothetical protein